MLYVVVNKSINKSDKNIITEESITENKTDEEKNYQYSEDEIDVVTEDDENEAENETKKRKNFLVLKNWFFSKSIPPGGLSE